MEDEEIEIEVNCKDCSSPILLDIAEGIFIKYSLLNGNGAISLLQYFYVPCPHCGKEWFMPYHDYLALCVITELNPN